MPKLLKRCPWPKDDPLYLAYHDMEWGVPVRQDQKLFEFITLESAQAGLSWITILRKRENYRKAFAGFDVEKVAGFTDKRIAKIMLDQGVVRNERKIRAAINNAQSFMKIQDKFGSFYEYSMSFVGGKPLRNKWKSFQSIPSLTKESEAFSKSLKSHGFKFVGPTIVYAHMQACGMVNDHTLDCFRHQEIDKLMK